MPSPLSQEELQAIREREAKATPGPWTETNDQMHLGEPNENVASWSVRNLDGAAIFKNCGFVADNKFIAHARTDIPRLLEALDAANARVAELEAEVAQLNEFLENLGPRRDRKVAKGPTG